MAMPGKLCVGILEEDNPLRSYFRFKPLLIEENGRYNPFEDHEYYPDEGCIRIVPDKNESYYFKSRMRQNGLFSVVDLRDHPGENDKIRPNKNYRHGGEEINAYIIYSDVVRAPAPDMIYQLLPVEALQGPVARPHTRRVLLRQENGVNPICYEWDPADDNSQLVTLKPTQTTCAVADFQAFEVPGFRGETLAFLIKPAALMSAVCESLEHPVIRHEPLPAPEKREEKPAPGREREKTEQPEAPKPESRPAPEPEPAEEKPKPQAPEKPWIHHDESMLPPPVDPRLSRTEQLLAAQSGLNPRRGRSLQELIDEKWAHSRLNQLGMSVDPIATGKPVRNPVDVATEAVREAWGQPQLREELLNAVMHMDGIIDVARARWEAARQSTIVEELNALEAQRLELLNETDHLKANNQKVREQLKLEIRQDEAGALADAVEKTRAAQAECSKYEKLAEEARLAAEDARALLDQLAGKELEAKIRDVALTRHVEERLELLRSENVSLPPVPEKLGINALIDRLMARARALGWQFSREEAANLCVCLALSPALLLSGGPGCGKTSVARLLAGALGTDAAGRCVLCPPARKSLCEDSRVEALGRFPETPAIIILDDCNVVPTQDVFRGAIQCFSPEWRIIATLQDAHSGQPLNANTLDRGFMVRLSVPADLPWQPPVQGTPQREPLASIEDIRASLPRTEVPTALVERMNALRRDMADCGAMISRRALNDAWRYCSVMLALMGQDAIPDSIFDRAVAQRILPALLAAAPIEAVMKLRELTLDMPVCQLFFKQPLPVSI